VKPLEVNIADWLSIAYKSKTIPLFLRIKV